MAFSSDLRQVLISTLVIRVPVPDATAYLHRSPARNENLTDFTQWDLGRFSAHEAATCCLQEHGNPGILHCVCVYSWDHAAFSPSGQYLVVLRGPGQPSIKNDFKRMEFLIFGSLGTETCEDSFRLLATKLSVVKDFAFHPFLGLMAISQLSVTVLWFYAFPGMIILPLIYYKLGALKAKLLAGQPIKHSLTSYR